MFTGIIQETGTVTDLEPTEDGLRLHIDASTVLEDLGLGDSVAVNGVCLTATAFYPGGFAVDAVPETLARSNLGEIDPGAVVNLERPLRMGGRLDGHIVQGHVDGTGTVIQAGPVPDGGMMIEIDAEPELLAYVVEKGSIAVNGVSLTVAALGDDGFSVALIPHTLATTNLGRLDPGATVNLEADVIAKYVERLMEPHRR